MSNERRVSLRVPESRLITQIVAERPCVASIINLSATGLFTVKPSPRIMGDSRIVQLEIPLPEASETVWAAGRVMFERSGQSCIGSGIHFVAMADRDRRLIGDLVEWHRHEILSRMMEEIRRHKQLFAFPSPFGSPVPPPPLTENTVRMYLIPKA